MTVDPVALARDYLRVVDEDFGHDALGLAAVARALLDRDRQLQELLRERESGPMPHKCLNPECGTIEYGTGYKACPGCGGTDGRAALAASDPGPADTGASTHDCADHTVTGAEGTNYCAPCETEARAREEDGA